MAFGAGSASKNGECCSSDRANETVQVIAAADAVRRYEDSLDGG